MTQVFIAAFIDTLKFMGCVFLVMVPLAYFCYRRESNRQKRIGQ